MLLGSILTPYSLVLCICRFCGLYVSSVYSVAGGCSMLHHILMMIMQLMLRHIQHQAMRNSIGFSPSSVICSIYFSFHDRARGCSSFSSAATIQALNCTPILDIHCWYPMYSLRLAPQWSTFTSFTISARLWIIHKPAAFCLGTRVPTHGDSVVHTSLAYWVQYFSTS